MITIKDVAKQARVSPGTVSNALSGKRPVSKAARQRIEQAIDELGYQPNLVARSLVNRQSNTVAVVASGLEYYGPSRTLVGMEQQAHELGYSLLLSLLHRPDTDKIDSVLNDLTARRVDGIIWAVHQVGDNRGWIQKERLQRSPPIIFLTMELQPEVSIVAADNQAGGRLATKHLLEQGRRTVGLITGPLTWWEARARRAGWQQSLHEAGLAASSSLVVEGDWSAASGERGLYALLDRHSQIDAVFASNDQMALGALRAAHLLGRRVPQDLAIVGFDNIPEAAYFWPPLTSVRQHLMALGRMAVQELRRAIEARREDGKTAEPVFRLIAPELVVRESSGLSR